MIRFILREMGSQCRVLTRGVTWFAFCKEHSSCKMKVGEPSVRVPGTNSASKEVAGELVSPGEIHALVGKKKKD